jgi:iron complex transport system ATP-binding protein
MLEIDSLSVRRAGKALLDGISLSFGKGEAVALVGPNGAGKTTLLRVLSGELAPSAGMVKLNGKSLASYGPKALALRRAVLSQNITCSFPFTVADIVRMGAGDAHGPKIEAMIDSALADVDLADFAERTITTLSGGEQQRAHFARVVVQLACGEMEHGPGVLMLDEPTASLDLRHQLDLIAAAKRCSSRGVMVIAVLHDLNLAALFADRLVVMNRGKVVADGSPSSTITDTMLARVFRVDTTIGCPPSSGIPFVLPQTMTAAKGGEY